MSLEDYRINGVTYSPINSLENTCEGCAGNYDSEICKKFREHCSHKIWVIKEEDTLQDYIQKIEEKYPEEDRNAINPKHYDLFPEHGIQVRELMQVLCDKLDRQGFSGFLCSDYVQAMQYFLRWFEKNGIEDIEKGIWYMNKIIHQVQEMEKL